MGNPCGWWREDDCHFFNWRLASAIGVIPDGDWMQRVRQWSESNNGYDKDRHGNNDGDDGSHDDDDDDDDDTANRKDAVMRVE